MDYEKMISQLLDKEIQAEKYKKSMDSPKNKATSSTQKDKVGSALSKPSEKIEIIKSESQ